MLDMRLAQARAALDVGRFDHALSILQSVVDTRADQETLGLVGQAMVGLGMEASAAEIFESAANLGGPDAFSHALRAAALYQTAGNDEQAQLIGLRLLRERPDDPDLVFLLVGIFEKSGELELAQALAPRLAASEREDHLIAAARVLADQPRNPANRIIYRKLRALLPDQPYVRFANLAQARDASEFDVVEREEALLKADIAREGPELLACEEPHAALIWLDDEAQLQHARNVGAFTPFTEQSRSIRRQMPHDWSDRIRIGYVSGDLWDDHATMRLLGEVLTLHDRERFDITLFCNTPDHFRVHDKGGRALWGDIVSIVDMDDEAAERLVRSRGIDVLVDLKGWTANHRLGLFNRQAAPVQVAWLGFPGSTVMVDFDYVIGDRFTLPDAAAPHFHERFCRLPETYQPNETRFRPRPQPVTRAALDLPEDVFLLSSFNSPKKLTPFTLELWADVMKAAPSAHLAVMAGEGIVDAFARRGIERERIHPLGKCAYEQHMARAAVTDLALDTFPCNGHTTTSDMLWAGVPIVTMRGQTFAGRVSESLLNAVGLADLVAPDRQGFVALAASIASDCDKAATLKERLETNRFLLPLFDAERFCRHLENAYAEMAARARAGEAPAAFDVPALPPRTGPFRH